MHSKDEKFKKIKRGIGPDGHLAPHEPILLLVLIGATLGDRAQRNFYSAQGLISLFQQVWNGLQSPPSLNLETILTASFRPEISLQT